MPTRPTSTFETAWHETLATRAPVARGTPSSRHTACLENAAIARRPAGCPRSTAQRERRANLVTRLSGCVLALAMALPCMRVSRHSVFSVTCQW